MNLPTYEIPDDLKIAVEEWEGTGEWHTDASRNFLAVLSKLNKVDCLEIAECHYRQFLKLGLYVMEHQDRAKKKPFTIRKLRIKKVENAKNTFKAYINLKDDRYSGLDKTDMLIVHKKNYAGTKHQLYVSEVCNDHVVVTGDQEFCETHSNSAEYSAILVFSTFHYRCCHYALSTITASQISNYFFPKKLDLSFVVDLDNINYKQTDWFNKDVLNNPEQKQAVVNIVNKSSFPAPYIVYGPAGTGKTSTIVEAMCQIWKKTSADYILVCAASNNACDVVAKSLLRFISADNIYRIYSSVQYGSIDDDIKKCSNVTDEDKLVDLEEVDFSFKNIIITTLCSSLRLEKLCLPFSHLFIDEASQTPLAEACIPLCVVKSSPSCQIVMSGDHHQLGPQENFYKLGQSLLEQSILEKLMKCEPYEKDEHTGYDPLYVTKLIRNYRSHKNIIHTPNVLFYDNELIACSNTNSDAFSVAFHGVEGKERKVPHCISPYNAEEIHEVLLQIENFIGRRVGSKIITEKDIGIVTPFVRQAWYIKQRLNDINIKDVNVGTVEAFQGQEKEVIIVTTVRSEVFSRYDGVRHLGFLSNPKRFNVALTRAKTFLLVLGNPTTLRNDKHWRYFLRFCLEHNACYGQWFKLEDEDYYTRRNLNIGKIVVKSTDLFDRSIYLLTVDDGNASNKRKKDFVSFLDFPSSPLVNDNVGVSSSRSNTSNENQCLDDDCITVNQRKKFRSSSEAPRKTVINVNINSSASGCITKDQSSFSTDNCKVNERDNFISTVPNKTLVNVYNIDSSTIRTSTS